MEFAKQHCPDDELVNIVWKVYEVAPKILGEAGKIKIVSECGCAQRVTACSLWFGGI
jgi:hypothetical protein